MVSAVLWGLTDSLGRIRAGRSSSRKSIPRRLAILRYLYLHRCGTDQIIRAEVEFFPCGSRGTGTLVLCTVFPIDQLHREEIIPHIVLHSNGNATPHSSGVFSLHWPMRRAIANEYCYPLDSLPPTSLCLPQPIRPMDRIRQPGLHQFLSFRT